MTVRGFNKREKRDHVTDRYYCTEFDFRCPSCGHECTSHICNRSKHTKLKMGLFGAIVGGFLIGGPLGAAAGAAAAGAVAPSQYLAKCCKCHTEVTVNL